MNYLAVYNYFKDVSQNLGVTVKWFHGRRSIQNLTKFEGGFYFFSNPFTSAGSLTDGTRQVNDTWTASITIAMQDQADGDIDQNNEDDIQPSIRAITLCENIAEKYIHYLNENTINDSLSSSAQEINVVSVNKSPVFRDTAYMLSGITLDISFTVMDDFDYCCDPVPGVNPSPITNFVYSNNGQSVESGGFVTMVPTVTPTDGTYTYFLNPSDTLPTGLRLNGATGYITRSGTIPDDNYSFIIIVVGSGLASGIASVLVTMTIGEVGPVLTLPTDAANGSDAGTGTVTTDTGNGTLYWVQSENNTEPSGPQVEAGQDSTGSAASASGNQSVNSTGVQNISSSGLTPETTYYTFFYHKNTAGFGSNVASADGFTTEAAPFVNPTSIDGGLFWSQVQALTRANRNVATDQLNNEMNASLNGQTLSGGAISFVSASSEQTDFVDLGNIKAVEFWIKLGSTSETILGLSGTAQITVSSGTLTITGWTGATSKIDGVSGTTLDTDWHHVCISSATAHDANIFEIARGRVSGNTYGDITIKDIAVYSDENTDGQYADPVNFITNVRADVNCMTAWDCSQGIYSDDNPVIDVTGNGVHLTLSNAANRAVNNVEVGSQTMLHGFNYYDYFDGSTNYITTASPEAIFNDRTEPFRIDFKFVLSVVGGSRKNIISQNKPTSPFCGLRLCITTGGKVELILRDDTGHYFFIDNNVTILPNIEYTCIVTYDGSSASSGVGITVNGATALTTVLDTGPMTGSITPGQNLALGANPNASEKFGKGIIEYVKVYNDVNGTDLIHDYSTLTDWVDQAGSLNGTKQGTFTQRRIPSITNTDIADIFQNIIVSGNRWTQGELNGQGGLHDGTRAINLGNVRTLIFAIYVDDATTDQTIFDCGTPANITLTSSAIACSDFSSIVVDGSGNAIGNGSWHYVEMQNTTDVNIDAIVLNPGFNGKVVPFIAYPTQISAEDSASMKTWMSTIVNTGDALATFNFIFVGDSITNASSYPEYLLSNYPSSTYGRAADCWDMDRAFNNFANILALKDADARNVVIFQTCYHTAKVVGGHTTYESRLPQIVDLCTANDLEIVVLGLYDVADATVNTETDLIRAWLAGTYSGYNLYIDLQSEPLFTDHTNTTIYSDGTHLTSTGQQLMADTVYTPLDAYLNP